MNSSYLGSSDLTPESHAEDERAAFKAWAKSHNWTDEAINEVPMNGALQALRDIFCAGYRAATTA